jgi:hypothetical protein
VLPTGKLDWKSSGETIISEFRCTGFAGSAVREGSRTERGTGFGYCFKKRVGRDGEKMEEEREERRRRKEKEVSCYALYSSLHYTFQGSNLIKIWVGKCFSRDLYLKAPVGFWKILAQAFS